MNEAKTDSIIMADTVVEGDLSSAGRVVVNGRVQGSLTAPSVVINDTGAVYGSLRAESAEVLGAVQGEIFVRGLLSIASTGSVSGDVEYDKIAMEQGGNLSATLRNVPPHLAGDLDLTVHRGGSVRITTEDLTAFDPDDAAEDLTYMVSEATHGFVALDSAHDLSIGTFTQADIEDGRVIFVHDGAGAPAAGFEVVVADAKGATSGQSQHVSVAVKG